MKNIKTLGVFQEHENEEIKFLSENIVKLNLKNSRLMI